FEILKADTLAYILVFFNYLKG
mgnify:CR=1